jgi:Universal stress protein family
VEPSQGCWYRLGTICSDAVGGRTHNDAMASTGRFSSEPLASADRPQQSGRIVVGVDASQGSLNALLWALGEARARKIPVHAVLAWQYRPSWVDPGLGSMFPLGYVPDGIAVARCTVERLMPALGLSGAVRGAALQDHVTHRQAGS